MNIPPTNRCGRAITVNAKSSSCHCVDQALSAKGDAGQVKGLKLLIGVELEFGTETNFA